MKKTTTRFSYFLMLLLCTMHNFANAQYVDISSFSSPIILGSDYCDAYFSNQSNVTSVTWWYNYAQYETTDNFRQLLPSPFVDYSLSSPNRLNFQFLTSGDAPLKGQLVRIERRINSNLISQHYYVSPYQPKVGWYHDCGPQGSTGVYVRDDSGNYSNMPRVFQLIKDGNVVATSPTTKGQSYRFGNLTAGIYTAKILIYTTQGRPSSSSTPISGEKTFNYSPTVPPVINVTSGSADICPGQSVRLSASAGTSFRWNTNATTQTITASPSGTQTFTVTLTDANGCSVAPNKLIVVHSNPQVNIGADAPICAGTSKTIYSNIADGTKFPFSYTWSNGSTDQNIKVNSAGTYTLTVTDRYGCSGSDAIVLSAAPNPTVTASEDKSIAAGSTTILTSSTTGGTPAPPPYQYTYSWTGGSVNSFNSSANVRPTQTTTYTVEATDGKGCKATDQVVITVISPPVVNAGPDRSICQGLYVSLSAVVTSGGKAPFTYQWSHGVTGSTTNVNPPSTTTYTVTVTDALGQSSSDQLIVTVNPTPSVSVANQSICAGSVAQLRATGGNSSYVYNWSRADGDQGDFMGTTSGEIVQVSPVSSAIYRVSVTHNGCESTAQAQVVVKPNPTVTIDPIPALVNAGTNLTLTARGSGGTTPYQFLWSNNATTSSITIVVTATTTYAVQLTDVNGCRHNGNVVVTVPPNPTANAGADKIICAGNAALLSVTVAGGTAPYTYAWSTGASTTSIAPTPTTTTTYSVTVTDKNFKTSTDQVVVTVNPKPTANARANQTICAGSSATLTGAGSGGTAPYTYAWTGGTTGSSTVVSPGATTTYTLTVTDNKGCSGTSQVVVSVNPKPTANAGANQTICAGSSATLTGIASGGTAPYTYAWTGGGTGSSTSVSPAATTTYTLTVTDNKGCSGTSQVVVSVNPKPTANAGANQTICAGLSATLTGIASGGTAPYTYAWTGGGTGSSTSVSPAATTTYTLTVTDNKGCSGTSQVVVSVNLKPTANAGVNQAICAGSSATLTGIASGGTAPYTYAWTGGGTGSSTSVSPAATTTYTLTVSDSKGCSGISQVVVSVNPKPTANAGVNQTICAGSSATLTGAASGGTTPYTYAWTGGTTGSSNVVSPVATTTYTLTVTDNKGCSGISQVVVSVNPKPSANAGVNQTICAGSSATLTGTGSGGTAPYTYAWTGGGTGSSTSVSPAATTTYTLTVSDNKGCSGTSQVVVSINPKPTANAGVNQTICAGSSATLTGTGSGGTAPYTYAWMGGTTGSSNVVSPGATTTYTLTVTDNKGCSGTSQVVVSVNPKPSANAGVNQTICAGSSATLTGIASSGTAPYSYAWTGGASSSSTTVSPGATTTYTLTVSDSKGCSGTSQVVVTVNPNPTINAGADQTICPTLSTTLSATVSGGSSPYRFAWSNGTSSSTQSVSPAGTTTYSLRVTDNNNCSATDQVVVTVTALDFNIDGPAAVCAGESLSLSPTTTGTYAWSTGANSASISVAPTMTTTYTLTLTANGCSLAKSKTVTVNALPTFTLPTLFSACMGSSTVLAPQGLNPATGISYQWTVPVGVNSPGNVATLTTNKAGQYQLKITNIATGCNHTKITTLKQIPRPTLYDPSLTIACGSNGTQTLKLLMKAAAAAPLSPEETSPTLLYLYRVLGSSSWQNSNALEINLPTGAAQTYEVSVMYQSGLCATDLPIKSIAVPASPLSLPNLNLTSANATDCYTSNGSISVTNTASVSPFLEYALRNDQNVMIRNWQDAKVFDRLIPGDYSVEVRLNAQKINLNGCATTLGKVKAYALAVGSTALPSIQDLVKTHLSSCATDNGAVEIKASYLGHLLQFKVDNQPWQDSPVFPGLAKNGHTASVRPANGCPNLVVSQAFTLNPASLPAPIAVQNTPPVHCSQPNGSISISLPTTLQTKDWLVSIDGGGTYIKNQWTWRNLDRGNYLVSVAALDKSCRQDYAQTITFDPPCEEICGDGLDNDLDGKVDCADEFCQASYSTEITGKSFCRDDAKFIFTNLNKVDKIRKVGGEWGTQTAYLNLPAGPIAFEIRSTAGCIQREQHTFATPRPAPEPSPDFYVNCNATKPGVLIVSNRADYAVGYRKLGGAWNWSFAEGAVVFQNLEPGTYEVATSESGEGSCMTIASKKIDIFPAGAPVLQSLEQYAPNTCSTNDGRIVILAKGYNVEYAIRPQGSNATLVWAKSNEFKQLAPGTYQVFARHTGLDERFCATFNQIFSQTVILTVPTLTIALVNTQGPTNACINDPTLNGSITITATKPSGSTGKLVYSIDGGTTFVSNPVFTGLGPGSYTPAVAFEDRTCKTTGTVVTMTPVQAPAITSVTTTAPTACGQQSGKITINTAAVGSWKYSIDGGATFQTSKDFLNLKALFNYNIVVATNDLNCRNNYGMIQIPKKADCVENCTDGIDNDGNGLIDCDDPSCSGSTNCPAGVDRIVCPGSTITIGQSTPANPAYCYTWVPTTGLATPHQPSTQVTPTQSGQYELIITDGNGQIVKRDKINIVVDPITTVTITASAPAYCGKTITLQAPSGYSTYTWKDASNTTLGTTSSIQVNQAGAYTLKAIKAAGCEANGSISISNLTLSIATIAASTLCQGAVVELRAQTPAISGVDLAYRWSNGATTSAISAGAGAYTLTLTEVKGNCQLTAQQTLSEATMPQLIVSADKPAVCQGQTTQLRAELSAYDNIQSYTWTGPAGFNRTGREVTSPALNASTAGEYQLTVAFTNGCSLSKSVTLTHLAPRQATVCNNGPICPGTELKLSASYGYTYQWTGPNNFSSSEQNPVLPSGVTGVYSVTLTDSNGCVSTQNTQVSPMPTGSN